MPNLGLFCAGARLEYGLLLSKRLNASSKIKASFPSLFTPPIFRSGIPLTVGCWLPRSPARRISWSQATKTFSTLPINHRCRSSRRENARRNYWQPVQERENSPYQTLTGSGFPIEKASLVAHYNSLRLRPMKALVSDS